MTEFSEPGECDSKSNGMVKERTRCTHTHRRKKKEDKPLLMVRTKTAGIWCIQWKWGRTKGKRRRCCTLFFHSSLWCQRRLWLRRREAINDLNNNAALCIPCHTLACLPLRGLSHTVSTSTAYLPHAATPSCSCPPVPSLTLSNPSLSLSTILTFSLPCRLACSYSHDAFTPG